VTRTRALVLAVLAFAFASSGCGVNDPYNGAKEPTSSITKPPATPTVDSEDRADEQLRDDTRDPDAAVDTRPPQSASAEQVAAAYGLFQTNWSWKTYRAQYDRMRRLAGGGLARDLAENPPESDQLRGIKTDRQTNRSTLLAVESRVVSASEARAIIVYSELAGGHGVTEDTPRATVYGALLKRLPQGWRVTEWSRLPS
jgi:hypothetical protein